MLTKFREFRKEYRYANSVPLGDIGKKKKYYNKYRGRKRFGR